MDITKIKRKLASWGIGNPLNQLIYSNKEIEDIFESKKTCTPNVTCRLCKCILKEKDACWVSYYYFILSSESFCLRCAPPYNKVIFPLSSDGKTRYFKINQEIEVTEEGKVIKK